MSHPSHSPESPPPLVARTRLRGLLAGIGAAALVGSLLLAPPATAAPETITESDLGLTAEVENLGTVATEHNIRQTAAATLTDGRELLYGISDGEPAVLNIVDATTGELISDFSLDPKAHGGTPLVAADGTLYFPVRDGSGVEVHRYDPYQDTLELLFSDPFGESVIRGLEIDEEAGMLYGNTYPNAKVFSYDLATEELHDYGSLVDDDIYAWGFARQGGTLYSGTGMEVGHAMQVDIASGEITELPLPAEYSDVLTYFYSFQEVGDYVAMAFSPGVEDGTNTAIWDSVNEDWVCEGAIGTFLSLNSPITTAGPDGRVYYKSEGEISYFDPSDCSTGSTGWSETGLDDTGSHRTLDLITVGEGDDAHAVLLGTNNDGSFWRFDPVSGEHELFESTMVGAPLVVHSLNEGPDGRIYSGTYLGPGTLGVYDPATGEQSTLPGPGQVDSWQNHGETMLLGSYPGAIVSQADPAEEWDGTTNPGKLLDLKADAQDRIMSMDSDGEMVAIGTVADYGVTGGALTMTDLEGDTRTYRDFIDKQSVTAVDIGPDSLVYGGTSIRGGLSSSNSTEDAHVFVLDPASGELLSAEIPVPGSTVIGDVVVRDGTTWGITSGGYVFAFDNETREVTATAALGSGGAGSPWGLGVELQENPVDGLLYGMVAGTLFALDPATGTFQILATGDFTRMIVAPQTGELYLSTRTDLLTVQLEGAGQVCDETISEDAAGSLTINEGITCIEGATFRGPVSVDADAGLVLLDAEVRGPVNAVGAAVFSATDSTISGPLAVTETGEIEIRGTTVHGPLTLHDNDTGGSPPVISGSTIRGPLDCVGNSSAPIDDGSANTVRGGASGQCAEM